MDNKIFRRLDALQQIADRNRPCKITVTFADGSKTIVDPCGAINLFREMGPFGAITSVEADRPEYAGLADTLTAVCRPAANKGALHDGETT